MSVIDKILDDHEELRTYGAKFVDSEQDKWFSQFVWELTRHHIGEELVVYPLLEKLGQQGMDLAKEGRQEHHQVKLDLEEIHSTKDTSKIKAMLSNLMTHLEHEESKDLPLLKKLSHDELVKAGELFQFRKKIAPTHTHMIIPEDNATVATALGLMIAPIDKLRDMFLTFPSKEEKQQAEKEFGDKEKAEDAMK